jgi:DNA-binding transcriptional LysR family regulator
MITLQKLKIFLVVYDRRSLNRAAGELLMAQSAVSQHMHELEAAYGAQLFERSSRGVEPTEAGRVLHGYAEQIMRLLSSAERDILQIGQAQQQQLIVSATPGMSVYLLPGWLRGFQQTYPNVNVSLQTELTAEIVRAVLNGRYHLGFLEGALDELDHAHLGRMRTGEIDYVVVVDRAHPWAARGAIAAGELAGQPFINRQPNSRTRRWLEALLAAHGVRLHNTAELDSPGAIKYALLERMGISILPTYSVAREVERGELHALRITGIELVRPLLMVWDVRAPFTPLQRAFIGHLAAEAPQLRVLL